MVKATWSVLCLKSAAVIESRSTTFQSSERSVRCRICEWKPFQITRTRDIIWTGRSFSYTPSAVVLATEQVVSVWSHSQKESTCKAFPAPISEFSGKTLFIYRPRNLTFLNSFWHLCSCCELGNCFKTWISDLSLSVFEIESTQENKLQDLNVEALLNFRVLLISAQVAQST